MCTYTKLIGLSLLMGQIIANCICTYIYLIGLSILMCQIIAVELLYVYLYITV